MKKIFSIILALACILCVVSCGEESPSAEVTASSYAEVCAVLRENAAEYRISDQEEIDKYESFFTGEANDYTDAISEMCYAKMPDGKYIRCIDMYYAIDADYFARSYGSNYDYIVCNDTFVIFGTSSFISEFSAE